MMTQPQDLTAAYQDLVGLGERVHLTGEETQRGMARLVSAAGALAADTVQDVAAMQQALMAGLKRNIADDPMLVAWALRLAARLGERPWQRFFDNFVVRLVAERPAITQRLSAELGRPPPVTLVINPTMACNLRCRGCYAFEFPRTHAMPQELFQRIVNEARDLGIRFLVITGGEPFVYKPLLDVAANAPDMTFMVYSNGTLIDDEMAARLAELGNIFPALSVEGFEPETDARRGEGVFQRVTAAMERLRQAGVLFGVSVTPTSMNTEVVTTDAFVDEYLERGANFMWLFTYMPVGRDPELALMATPEQRDHLRQTTLRWRRTKPLFIGDFWNDGAACGGCLSASRYAFISAEGNVQPCTFVHFHTHNINNHSLREIFETPFFQAIRNAQPYDRNLLRPCKIIDHPHVLRQVVDQCQAQPAYPGADALIRDPRFTEFLDQYALRYGQLAEQAWKGPDYQDGHRVLVPFSGLVDLYTRFPDRMANAERVTSAARQTCAAETDTAEPLRGPGHRAGRGAEAARSDAGPRGQGDGIA